MILSRPKAAADVIVPREGFANMFVSTDNTVAVKTATGEVVNTAAFAIDATLGAQIGGYTPQQIQTITRKSRIELCKMIFATNRYEELSDESDWNSLLSTNELVYINPAASTNGTGTFLSPRNSLSGVTLVGKTLLFREGTTFTGVINSSAVGNYQIGTYSLIDGSIITGSSMRRAIIAPTSGTSAIQLSGASIVKISSVIIKNMTVSGLPHAIFLGNNAVGSRCLIEHVDCYNITGTSVGTLFNVRCERATVRYNNLTGSGIDLLWGQTSTANGVIFAYGNEFHLRYSNVEGPDAIQLNRNGTDAAYTLVVIQNNFITHAAPSKQSFIISGGTASGKNEMHYITSNFFFGPTNFDNDPSGNASGGVCIYNDADNLTFSSNYVEGYRSWLSAIRGNPNITCNVFINTTQAWVSGSSKVNIGATFGEYSNNTHITTVPTSQVGQGVVRLAVLGVQTMGNIFYGAWGSAIRSPIGAIEAYNVFFGLSGTAISTPAGVEIAVDATDSTADPLIDFIGRPSVSSSVRDVMPIFTTREDFMGNSKNEVSNLGAIQD